MSRTFRKDEYKNDVAPGATDIDYLERNCLYVERFYKNTNPRSFDLVVKYEALLENSKESLEKIASLLCMKVSEEEVDNAIKLTSKEEIKKSVESGSVVATNMYLGDKKDYRWARDYAAERLQDVMGAFGY